LFYTPLRYPGGKGKLASYIKLLFECNDLFDGHYVEPYAGGAGVAIELLLQEYASHIHINDIDPAIYAFWQSVLFETDDLCKMIHDTRVNMSVWKKMKKILNGEVEATDLELGFATFFLNRTNRSGILKAGVIGGKEQSGKWKLDVRYNKIDLIERIYKIANYSSRISLYTTDAFDMIENLSDQLPEKTLFYLDPPYYVKGKGLYRNFYNHNDHLAIAKMLSGIKKQLWVVSYDNVNEIKMMYKKYRQQEYLLSYTAQLKTSGAEVFIYGPRVKYPRDVAPYLAKTA
jgi:DNA adenine methylase